MQSGLKQSYAPEYRYCVAGEYVLTLAEAIKVMCEKGANDITWVVV